MKNIFKSVWSIVAGALAGAILSISTDMILEGVGFFPSPQEGLFIWWMLLIALFYRGVYTIASGYITASLAPRNPMKHAVILGIIGVLVSILGTIANWDKSSAWYPISLILITLPCTWIGAIIKLRKA